HLRAFHKARSLLLLDLGARLHRADQSAVSVQLLGLSLLRLREPCVDRLLGFLVAYVAACLVEQGLDALEVVAELPLGPASLGRRAHGSSLLSGRADVANQPHAPAVAMVSVQQLRRVAKSKPCRLVAALMGGEPPQRDRHALGGTRGPRGDRDDTCDRLPVLGVTMHDKSPRDSR